MKISERVRRLSPSVTVELNAKIAQMLGEGKDVIKMNIGEPDFDTPDHIKAAAKRALDEGFTKYTAVPGILGLRECICKKLLADNKLTYKVSEICVTAGAKQAIMNAVLTIAEEGDEILIPIPCWVSYESMVEIAGAKPVLVPTKEDFRLDFDAIEQAVTERTRGIIINTPNNPTGIVYPKEDLERLAALADQSDFFVISDEIYEKLIYEGARHVSMASLSENAWEHTITINGVSKAYSMTGWRIGYMAGPGPLIKKAAGLQGHMTSASNAIAQKAAQEAIGGPQESVELMRREFDKRRLAMYERLIQMPDITCQNAEGAFYLMPDVSAYYGRKAGGREIKNSVDMAAYLLDAAGVAVVPGDGFYAPKNIRLSYSNSMENLMRGLTRMEEALKGLRGF
ncbi:MAG: pyridoxal phosphate-dependent aminotransferase [Lachnospiraceae bacterium]|nr:pyridoxal phosphate-dependent aminotransferase [Lachnospiraceae bacterium]